METLYVGTHRFIHSFNKCLLAHVPLFIIHVPAREPSWETCTVPAPGSLHFNAGTNNPGGCILSYHQGPCTVLSALLHKPANSPNSTTVHTLSAHFTDKESEAQRDEVTWSLPPS